ncbi:uncharacterized protein LOC135146504, partial [Zophobas morio]|uniref:uncharacterized protein LOC135146504 n=1 Tax=Zophobas morio TaxID=2755281 RepID=UPI0030838B0C
MGSSISYSIYEESYPEVDSSDCEFFDAVDSPANRSVDEESFCYESSASLLDASNLVKEMSSHPWIVKDYKFLNKKEKVQLLNKGSTLLSFCCHGGAGLSEAEKNIVDSFINMSYAFQDEVKENGVPFLDINDELDLKKYTVFIMKVAYLIPDVTLETITPELISSDEYILKCVPGPPILCSGSPDKTTFRISKTVIPYIYNVTVQLKVSEITSQKDLARLSSLDGAKIDRALIMERTKRNISKFDSTAKAKSLLSYRKVKGGLFVTNITVILNTLVPAFISPFVDRL